MGTLTHCLSPAQSSLPKEDKDYIRERSKEYQDTDKLSVAEARLNAAEDVLSEYTSEHEDIVDQVESAGGVIPKEWALSQPLTEKKAEPTQATEVKEKVSDKKPVEPSDKEKIIDVGEKIGGARKDTWQGFRDKLSGDLSTGDILSVPFNKAFPEPNYKALAKQGADIKSLALIKVMRDEVPPKPRGKRNYKSVKYVEGVATLREAAKEILSNEEYTKNFLDKLRKSGRLNTVADRVDLMFELGFPKSTVNLEGIILEKRHYSLYGKEKDVNKWVVDVQAKSSKSSGGIGGVIAVTDARGDAVEALKHYLKTEDAKPKTGRKTTFTVYKYKSDQGRGWIVGKKVGRNYIDLSEGFKTSQEANLHITENQNTLEETLKHRKEIPAHRRASNEARVGKDYREGKDVSADDFREVFGFRGVEFGNWVEQTKRQESLNDAYDGLMDLANLLDIPAKAISLDGELGMAFGARGKGKIAGGITPAAHYESGMVVINLTKKNGAGSLAHEWFHALDNYFSRMRGDNTKFVSDSPYELMNNAVRKEVLGKFKGVMTSINESGLPGRALKLDGRKTKAYWATNVEMAARSFESYVIERLKTNGFESDYLANIVSKEYWDAAESLGLETESSYPYPIEQEQESIHKAFDDLFSTIKTKETDKGVALYSKAKDKQEPQSTTKQLTDTLLSGRFKKPVKKMMDAGKLQIVQSEDGLPMGIDRLGTAGMFIGTSDVVYLVADNLSVADVTGVSLHEIFHARAEAVIGEDQYSLLMDRLDAMGNKKDVADWYKKALASVPSATPAADVNSEIAAYAIEQAETNPKSLPAAIAKWVRDFIAAIRVGLMKIGWMPNNITQEDLSAIARSAVSIFADTKVSGDAVPVYSREAPIFYSALTKAIQDIKQNLAPPAQWKAIIAKLGQKGVKAEEISWSGVDGWLDAQTGKVTKDDLVAYLKSQEVQVDEVIKSSQWEATVSSGKIEYFNSESEAQSRIDEELDWAKNESTTLTDEDDGLIRVVDYEGNELFEATKNEDGEWVDTSFSSNGQEYYDKDDALSLAKEKYESNIDHFEGQISTKPELSDDSGAKFAEWQMKGEKEGYQELLLRYIDPEPREFTFDEAIKNIESGNGGVEVRSEGRLIARANTVEQLNRVREEPGLSFREPETSKTKYSSKHYDESNILAHVRFNERTIDGKKTLFIEEIQSDWAQEGKKKGYLHEKPTQSQAKKYFEISDRDWDGMDNDQRQSYVDEIVDGGSYIKGVPDTPFKKTETWTMLAFKRMVRYAAENGFDQISWTPGEVQAERYDLSNWVDSIWHRKVGDYYDVHIRKDGETVIQNRSADKQWLESNLGKDITVKIIGEDGDKDGKYLSLVGLNLKVGGEGMAGFYDQILPKAAGRFGKKFGAKVSTSETVEGQEVWTLPLTKKMSESAMSGQPLFSKRKPDYTKEEQKDSDVQQKQEQVSKGLNAGQPIDKIFRKVFQMARVDKVTGKVYERAVHYLTKAQLPQTRDDGVMRWMNGVIETARHGLIDRYGLPDDYVTREFEADADKRKIELQAMDILKLLDKRGVTDVAEAQALQAVLTGEAMPEGAWSEIAAPIREAIDQMGLEAMQLGLITREAYEKNKGSYLHRVYRKHEAQQTKLGEWFAKSASSRRKKIRGDSLKGRGMTSKLTMNELLKNVPNDWWGRKLKKDQADKQLKGKEFYIFDREQAIGQGTEPLIDGGKKQKARIVERVYWPVDLPVPARMGNFTNKGKWVVRDTAGGKVSLWRDFTKSERENMGEILDARYTIAKTFMMLAHDLSTGRFMKDIAGNDNWATTQEPEFWENPSSSLSTYSTAQWVKVPTTNVAGTKVKKWGALSGMYVRAEIWRDLNELDKMQTPTFWQIMLTQWKLNKTSRNPVVHMNNVMSNMIFMDMADIRWRDLKRGLVSYLEKDEHYRDAMEHGAFGASYIEHEIRRDILDPIMQELMTQDSVLQKGVAEKWMQSSEWMAKFSLLGKIADSASKKAMDIDRKMIDVYQLEDEIFRMATYMQRIEKGDSKQDAARIGRDQFLNYDIRAPWVNAARRSFLPFIAYTYRAVPVIAKSISERPWKIAKYATIAYTMNMLAYVIDEGDEDEERRSMNERTQGKTWLGTPRLIRMPWSDENGSPVFLDIRRFIPAGDVFDMNQNQMPLPAWMQFGGPLMLAAEFALNKQAFTGKEIVNDKTDTPLDKATKYAGWAWRSWMPAHPLIPGSWYWQKIATAASGGRDQLGRDYDLPMAALSSLGVKLVPHDVKLGFQYKAMAFNAVKRSLSQQMRLLKSDKRRKMIGDEEYEKRVEELKSKMKHLQAKAEETFGDK